MRGRTVTLKVKYADFQILTRSRTCPDIVADQLTLTRIGLELLAPLFPMQKGVRLLGVSLSSLQSESASVSTRVTLEPRQWELFITYISIPAVACIGLTHQLTADCRENAKARAAVRAAHGLVPMKGDTILGIHGFHGKTRWFAMAGDNDEIFGAPLRKPASSHEIGQSLDDLSVQELDERIAALKAEIARLEEAQCVKQASLSAAAAFFKFGESN